MKLFIDKVTPLFDSSDGMTAAYTAPVKELHSIRDGLDLPAGHVVTLNDAIDHFCRLVTEKHREANTAKNFPETEINDDNKVLRPLSRKSTRTTSIRFRAASASIWRLPIPIRTTRTGTSKCSTSGSRSYRRQIRWCRSKSHTIPRRAGRFDASLRASGR